MTIITTATLPAEIRSEFDRLLLSVPMPKFGQDSDDLEVLIYYIEHKLMRKLLRSPIQYNTWSRKVEKAKSLLQTIEKEEAQLTAKDKNALLCTCYYFAVPPRRHGEIFSGLTFWQRARRFWRKNHASQ